MADLAMARSVAKLLSDDASGPARKLHENPFTSFRIRMVNGTAYEVRERSQKTGEPFSYLT